MLSEAEKHLNTGQHSARLSGKIARTYKITGDAFKLLHPDPQESALLGKNAALEISLVMTRWKPGSRTLRQADSHLRSV